MNRLTTQELAALDVMRNWSWRVCSPDGDEFDPAKLLSSVVNRLAMAGIVDPGRTMLGLLSKGEMLARGDIEWSLYRQGPFGLNCHSEPIPADRWRTLQRIMAEEVAKLISDEWPDPTVRFSHLNIGERDPYFWDFRESQFSTAIVENADPFFPVEECYFAYNIEVWPRFVDGEAETGEPVGDVKQQGLNELEITPRGRNLAEWWPDFVAELVCYVKEGLVPNGIGHQGQSTVFKEVAERLAQSGKAEPNRTQTQETINAVLRRLRQPEKP